MPTGLVGDVIWPADDRYDSSRVVFNAMIDRRPLAVLRCHDPSDVQRGIAYARHHDLPLSVKGGGHNVAGNAVCDDGLVLDLSPMKTALVDAAKRTARAGAGLLLGELDRSTQEHGLATPLGVVSLTGIAGLTLGGGLGWLNRKHGLACDNLVGAEVVTADGAVLHANTDTHPDLFWALRGGGGNFGVVTEFEYRLHSVGPVLAGAVSHPLQAAPEFLKLHDELVASAPDELSTAVSLALDPAGEPVITVALCWCGPHDDGNKVLEPLMSHGRPIFSQIGPVPYTDWQRGPDSGFPPGRLHYWKAGWLRDLTDAAITTLLDCLQTMPSSFSGIGLQHMGGAAARIASAATAFAHRAEQYDMLILSQWAGPADSERNIAWTRDTFAAMEPHLADAVYVNNLGDEGQTRVQAAYGANYERLAEVKRRYDPDNLLRINQNVAPAPA
ncbi:FAD-binding oxidoreductase [Pseudonocardia charpentierae]|uniref:FAD-binding oxidoreductase n=1 Tax=Pseudonocardia charpentierae TaxID=3075545 RepID=A0ABU2NK10_9PSEU|nr:FAD-binding oxidoreductase [Pseudonocardia sp. DSM 45834]MDT0353922.1 FAD-binding oxidoreductase [Pseudonocardia sp. DSM 45834]